jgi:FeS assembly SUF system protein
MSNLKDWVDKAEDDKAVDKEALALRVIEALKQIYDPEIPVNIYDLGLIYEIDVDDNGVVAVEMTLTTPGCPVAQTFPGEVENAVRSVEGVSAASVELVWDPPWCPDKLSEAAKLELGLL